MLRFLTTLSVGTSFIVFFEPAPYDGLIVLTMLFWLTTSPKIHYTMLPIFGACLLYLVGGFFSVGPYWNESRPRMFQIVSLYLVGTFVFFTIYFSEKTEERLNLCLRAYAVGCVLASVFGLLGYFNVAGLAEFATMYGGRIKGTFKDPNVFGSYMQLGVVFMMQALIMGYTKRPILTLVSLATVVSAVLLSFSRGSWGATVVSCTLMLAIGFLTSRDSRQRRRMVTMASIAFAGAAVALAGLLTIDSVSKMFETRFAVTQEYDEGPTGRFGSQKRSIPVLLGLPNGFGPVRFRLHYPEDPHSVYINSFASAGWLGGFMWIVIAVSTLAVGFRLMFVRWPLQRMAQVVTPVAVVIFMQGFQIDVEHWRMIYICFGAIWGLEAARHRWMRRGQKALSDSAQAAAFRRPATADT